MHDPAVFWNSERGFYVAPTQKLSGISDLEIWRAAFSADTGKPYCLPSWVDVRELINNNRGGK